MNESDLSFWKNRVSELEEECAKKQENINDLEKKIEIMEGCESIAKSGLFKDPLQVYIDTLMNVKDVTISALRQKVSELESKLAVKENLPKTKNGLCGESELSGLTPIKAAELIIENFKQGVCPIYERDSKGNIKYMDIDGEKYAVETGMYRNHEEVRQIAEHLLVYCNNNSEESPI